MVGGAPDGIVKCMESVIELFIGGGGGTRVINCHIINNPVRAGAAEWNLLSPVSLKVTKCKES